MCCWQPLSSSWSAASFSSGSESDPPVAFIHQGLLCPGMSLTLSSSHNPRWSRDVGCRGKFGTNPKGVLPQITPPPFFLFCFLTPIKLKLLPYYSFHFFLLLTITHGQRCTQTPALLFLWKGKSLFCDLCSKNAAWSRPMRRPVPLFAIGPRDNGEFSVLKQVLTSECSDFPGENRMIFPEACLFFASLQKSLHYLQIETSFVTALTMPVLICWFKRHSAVGTSPFFVFHPGWQLRG